MKLDRESIADMFIRGEGVEIGALHMPLRVPRSAHVRYVDRLTVEDLRKQYPELNDKEIVETDIIADGEKLESIADSSQDFVIANHFVEHCQNPIGAVLNMIRVLKPGGILYLAIPDKRCCFDADRPVTSLSHIMRDHREGSERSRRQHFEEWARYVNKAAEAEIESQVAHLMEIDYSIHFHAWTPFEMLEFILALRRMASFEIDLCFRHDDVEVIFILRKSLYQEPIDISSSRGELLAVAFDQALSPEPWCADDIVYDGKSLEMTGWALAPEGCYDHLTFTVNDREFEEREFSSPRSDLANIFWYKTGAARAGFRCRMKIEREELFRDGYATFKCIDRRTGQPIREEFNIYYADDADEPQLPDAARMSRVSGNDNARLFRFEGFSIFKKLDLALRQTTGKPISEFRDILDWGCGCGRVTRYFYLLKNSRVVGIDIDSDNVEWCRKHFKFGEYRLAPLHPPTDLQAESFDLIIGISVFSHLREEEQHEWLAELWRMARPGAMVLMSTMGEATIARSSWDEEMWNRWQETGFFAFANKSDLDSYIGDEDYYVNAFISEAYIRRSWSRAFEILDFIPAYIGNHQDLVVMRKPVR
jgi:2-polyprenyl-3-methyl-5-hydroxy-6-metoxy-1,4-benzoquinol methylase